MTDARLMGKASIDWDHLAVAAASGVSPTSPSWHSPLLSLPPACRSCYFWPNICYLLPC
jgi:hypothetical protein